jgi:hypothetical protein
MRISHSAPSYWLLARCSGKCGQDVVVPPSTSPHSAGYLTEKAGDPSPLCDRGTTGGQASHKDLKLLPAPSAHLALTSQTRL